MQPPTAVPGYEPQDFLGAGAYGEVWVAIDRNTGRRVAIKFYTHRGGLDWSLLSREVEKLAFLFGDRYVVQLLDVGWQAEPPFFVMEYMEQGSLEEKLHNGPLPADEALSIFRDVAVGLVHAHGKGVLHCDLKPANVLLDQDGKPRLADFGQSRLSHDQTPALGTLFYMAPEQADLEGVPEARWDVYALGALLYRMLVGHAPYSNEGAATSLEHAKTLEERLQLYQDLIRNSPRRTAHRKASGVDRSLSDVVDMCLAPNPKKRYRNVQNVLDALDARLVRKARRPLLVLGAVGPALLLLVMALFAWRAHDTAVTQSDHAVVQRTLESNRFLARVVAQSVAHDIDGRWQILTSLAAEDDLRKMVEAINEDPQMVAFVEEANGKKPTDAARETLHRNENIRKLEQKLDEISSDYKSLNATSWFLDGRSGIQFARAPISDKTFGQNYSFRDYFHGDGQNYEVDDLGHPPIQHVHRSIVFRSQATKQLMVAFSVPIWSTSDDAGDGEGSVIGILAMTVQLGDFSVLPADTAAGKVSVLVDTKPIDGTTSDKGRKGCVLEHPYFARTWDDGAEPPECYLDDSLVGNIERMRQLRLNDGPRREKEMAESQAMAFQPDYHDPLARVETRYGGRWLASIEPVFVDGVLSAGTNGRRDAKTKDTGWAIIIQEPYETAVAPIQDLSSRLVRTGSTALAIVVALITALWGVVILVFNESPRSRLTSLLRRRAGLSTQSSTSSSVLSDKSPFIEQAQTAEWNSKED